MEFGDNLLLPLHIFSIDDGFVCVTVIGDDADDYHVSCF